ncbi:MAG: branched-chain amino acid ABC transporter permease [Acidimicrobiales bacterium]
MHFLIDLFTHPSAWYQAHRLLVAQIGINSLLAVSIWVTLYAGMLTLANVGFMAIGGYTTVIMAIHLHTPLVLNMICGSLLAGLVGIVIGLPVLRLKGVYLAIATVGFGEVVRFGFILNLNITGKGQGLNNPAADPNAIVPVALVLAVLVAVLWRVTRSKIGQAWAAIRTDELAAASGAIDTSRYKLGAFVLGALIAGFAGGLDAHLNFFIDPTEYAFNRAVLVLIFAFVGGILVPLGPVLGATFLTALPEIVRSAKDYRDVVDGIILMLIVVFRPQGLIGRRGPTQRTPRRLGRRPRSPAASSPAPADPAASAAAVP